MAKIEKKGVTDDIVNHKTTNFHLIKHIYTLVTTNYSAKINLITLLKKAFCFRFLTAFGISVKVSYTSYSLLPYGKILFFIFYLFFAYKINIILLKSSVWYP